MRRQNGNYGKIVVGIIVVVILGISVFYLTNKNSLTEIYRQYVGDFEKALLEYSEKELGEEYSPILYVICLPHFPLRNSLEKYKRILVLH